MPGHLMVLNPAKKRRRHKRRKARLKARRKLTAKQIAAGFGGKRGRKAKRRAKAKVVIVESNPTKGSKMARKHRRRHRKHSRKVLRRRFRRNPEGSGFLSNTIAPAAVGAAGAVAVDFLQGMIPLGQSLSSTLQPVIGIGYSLLVGLGVDAVAGSKAGGEAAAGGIVVQLYNLFNQLLGQGGGYAGGSPASSGYGQMNRYLGYLRRNPRMLAAINQRRALKGLQPINMRPRHGLARHPLAVGTLPMNPRFGLGNTGNTGAWTRHRIHRGGGGLGYITPARNLSRYIR